MFFVNNVPGLNSGRFEIVTGNMFGGKSTQLKQRVENLLRQEEIRVRAAKRQGKYIKKMSMLKCKPSMDDRYDEENIVTHDGQILEAKAIESIDELVQLVEEQNYRIIVIDEIQFFRDKAINDDFIFRISEIIFKFMQENRYIIAAGLSKDFRGLPFGPMGELLAIADDIDVKNSRCAVCGADASLPQRFVDSEPAMWDEPIIAVGANEENGSNESYEPRCRRCHETKKNFK